MTLILRPCIGEAELRDPAVTGPFAQQMAVVADTEQVPPWCGYVGWIGGMPVGFGGFTGEPDDLGVVELGYLTFPGHTGQGVASAVAGGLVSIARANSLRAVIAHTLPREDASGAVLLRHGFVRDVEAHDPDEGTVWRWRLELGGDVP